MNGAADKKRGAGAGALIAGAVAVLALPSAVLAFSSGSRGAERVGQDSPQIVTSLVPQPLLSLAKANLFRFTPAHSESRPNSSVTVVVRVDPATMRRMLGNGTLKPKAITPAAPEQAQLRIAPTAFELGVAKGYTSFSQPQLLPRDRSRTEMPDINAFSLRETSAASSSRFSTRIVIDEKGAPGRAPRTFAGEPQEQVDVGGSYRVSGSLDVTAGVRRTSQQSERLRPLTDGKKDNQAVYVGTQFRF